VTSTGEAGGGSGNQDASGFAAAATSAAKTSLAEAAETMPAASTPAAELAVPVRAAEAMSRFRLAAGWLPATALLVYLAVLIETMPAFLERGVPQSDTVSPLLLTQALFSAGHGTIHLGAHAGFSNLLLVGVSLPFPDARVVSQVLPYAVYVSGALVVAGTMRLLSGWRASLLSFAVCLVATPALLFNEVSPAGRVTTLANLALLGLLTLRIVAPPMPANVHRSRLVAVSLATGAVTGFDIASDPYLLIVGILPLAATALVLWLLWRDGATGRLAKLAASLIGVAALSTLLTFGVAQLLQLHYGRPGVQLASPATLGHNVQLLGAAIMAALGETLSHARQGAIESVVGLLVCATVLASMVGSVVAVTKARSAGQERARAAHSLFWSLVAIATTLAYVATNYPMDVLSIRYLTPLWLALAALLPLLGRRRSWAPATLAVLVTALTAGNAWSLAVFNPPPPATSSPLVKTLMADHLTQGYADYWESNIVTWATEGKVMIRAVVACGEGGAQLCPDRLNSADGWYRPLLGPTVVIVDPRRSITRPPTAYGAWTRVISAGAIKIYVFDQGIELARASG
jgi:hypothetical protein